MATEILQIRDDDDEIEILYSTPLSFKSAATKKDAVSVEDYRCTTKTTIDLTLIDDGGVVEIPASSFPKRRRFYKGESSNSKRRREDDETVFPLSFAFEICADEKPVSDSFRIQGCEHSYCTSCVSSYVAARLQQAAVSAIGCPVPGCAGFLEPQHCRAILPPAVFDRWGDLLCEALILEAEKFYCPYKDCSALLINDGAAAAVVESECPECRRLFCAQCKAAWHAGVNCGEFQRRREDDEMSNEDLKLQKLVKRYKWVRCPRCQIYVSKNGGCQYVICSIEF
ncbi:hypothetical protein OROMI_023338 [Orobanche minor]